MAGVKGAVETVEDMSTAMALLIPRKTNRSCTHMRAGWGLKVDASLYSARDFTDIYIYLRIP